MLKDLLPVLRHILTLPQPVVLGLSQICHKVLSAAKDIRFGNSPSSQQALSVVTGRIGDIDR